MLSLLFVSVAFLFAIKPSLASNATAQSSYTYLQQSLSSASELFLSTDPNLYNDTTQRWSVYEQASYSLIVKPANETDVQTIVSFIEMMATPKPRCSWSSPDVQIKYASANEIPFITTGGGHGYATAFTLIKDGINIDLSLHREVSIDAAANTMTVGGAATFDQVFQPLYAVGKEIRECFTIPAMAA